MIGPTFGTELLAAGLHGLPFVWSESGEISGRENLTQEQNKTLDAVLAAHDPKKIIPVKTEAERVVDALIEAGIIPTAKAAAVLMKVRA